MRYSFIPRSLLASLAVTCVAASPIGDYPEDVSPNYPLAEGPGFKLCKKTPIRYNPKHFVCHDNEIICPILDQGSENPHAMLRCGESCFDDRLGSCENNEYIPGPPKRSWELGVDLAFAHHIQHAPSTPSDGLLTPPTPSDQDAAAAQALLARYAAAFGGTEEGQIALYKRYNDALTAEAQKYLEAEQRREDDQYLHLEKRWRRGSMKKDPVVRVKQTWDPRERTVEENRQGRIENGKSASREVLSTGEEMVVEEEEMDRKVVRLPIRRPVVGEEIEEVVVVEGNDAAAAADDDEGYVAGDDRECEEVEVEEEFQDEDLVKRDVGLDPEFEERMHELEKILSAVV